MPGSQGAPNVGSFATWAAALIVGIARMAGELEATEPRRHA